MCLDRIWEEAKWIYSDLHADFRAGRGYITGSIGANQRFNEPQQNDAPPPHDDAFPSYDDDAP